MSCFQSSLRLCLPAVLALMLRPGEARADPFKLDYLQPRVEALGDSAGGVIGTETFDGQARGAFQTVPSFDTTFGTRTTITGRYSGGIGILTADQYGGAGGVGNYIVTFANGDGYTLDLAHDGSIPGVNYFGMALSALDSGNMLDFLRDGAVVFSYTPDALIKALGPCSNGNAYCGNPKTPSQNTGELYAFISFTDQDGYFDQIRFRENGGGGYESDNHTVGYRAPVTARFAAQAAPVNVPEPQSMALLGVGLMALGLFPPRVERNLRQS